MINQVKYENTLDFIAARNGRYYSVPMDSYVILNMRRVTSFFIVPNLHSLIMEGNDYSFTETAVSLGKHTAQKTGSDFPAL
jgi:hypothetical protein